MILGSCLPSESPCPRRTSAIDNDRDVITVCSQRVQHGECSPVYPQNSSWCGSCRLIVRMMTQELGSKQLVHTHTQTSLHIGTHVYLIPDAMVKSSPILLTPYSYQGSWKTQLFLSLCQRRAPLGNSPVKSHVLCRSILGCSQSRP